MILEFDKEGNVTNHSPDEYIFNKVNKDFGLFKQYKYIAKDNKEYLIDPNKVDENNIGDEFLLSNYQVNSNASSLMDVIINLENHTSNMNYIMLDDITYDTEVCHVFNQHLIDYLKSFTYIGNENIRPVKAIIETLKGDKPLSHKKTDQLFAYLGTSYQAYFDWLMNNKNI